MKAQYIVNVSTGKSIKSIVVLARDQREARHKAAQLICGKIVLIKQVTIRTINEQEA